MKKHLLKRIGTLVGMLSVSGFLFAGSSPIEVKSNASTGALSEMKIQGDERNMNWVVKTDGTQYPWIKENYGWGLGYFTVVKGRESIKKEWMNPTKMSADGMEVTYRESDIGIRVIRVFEQDDLVERYTFTNEGGVPVSIYDIGIYTPFNDNYPDA